MPKDGYLLYNRNDVFIGRAIEHHGEFSGLEMDLMAQLCKPGDVVTCRGLCGRNNAAAGRRLRVRQSVIRT